MKWIIAVILCLAAAAVLCGYTTIRLPVRRREGKTRVACIGDSITYGCTLPLFFLTRYPTVLQMLLGPGYVVAAFGVNDRTLQNTGNKPYRKERAFRQSRDFLPDIVVILLGTNDSKDSNWISEEAFRQQYRELIGEYRATASKPRILLCTPPCAFKPVNRFFYITNDANFDRMAVIAELVRSVAEEEGLELADLYALTKGRRRLFGPDGLHPSAAGARAIAKAVYGIITEENENISTPDEGSDGT